MDRPPTKPRARLFAALDLPDRVRDGLAGWQAAALVDPALRPVRPAALHITLCFVGATERERIADVAAAVEAVTPRAVEVRLAAGVAGRPGRRPRIYALAADAPAAVELQGELAARLERIGVYERERRQFWPHVTVARVRSEPGGRRPRRVLEPPADLSSDLLVPFGAVRVSLYRSTLRPEGAEYASLASVDLPPVA